MDWNTRLTRALDYIETHLDDDIDLDYAAKLAYCHRNDLSNRFAMITGVPISEYIRRRKLSLAALDLQNSEEKIIDIALKYGYQSPTAFTRAFLHQHKATPQYVRSRGIFVATYSRTSFQIRIKGENSMNVRIEKKPAFKIVGAKQRFRNDTSENKVPDFWTHLPRATYDLIITQASSEPTGMLGLCANFDGKHEFDYYIAVSSNKPTPAGLEEIKIPEATWAIFQGEGDLIELVNRIWQKWFPSSGYRRAKNSIPDMEVYFDYDFPKANYTYELWYPVTKE